MVAIGHLADAVVDLPDLRSMMIQSMRCSTNYCSMYWQRWTRENYYSTIDEFGQFGQRAMSVADAVLLVEVHSST